MFLYVIENGNDCDCSDNGDEEEDPDERLSELQSRLAAAAASGKITEEEAALIEMVELRSRFLEWSFARKETIRKLRDIADYVESVSKRTRVAKVAGSGGGAVGGALTVVGGALTVFGTTVTAGAILPILVAGTSIGLASGLTGGAASITEKIVKSRQMAEAQEAIKKDREATELLEERLEHLQQSSVARKVAANAVISGGSAVKDSLSIFNMVTTGAVSGGGAEGLGKITVEAVSKIFGDEFGQEVSKLVLHTSGRVVTGTVTVVLGGATMIYDIYKLNSGLEAMANGRDREAAQHLREIADQLQVALQELHLGSEEESGEVAEKEEGEEVAEEAKEEPST